MHVRIGAQRFPLALGYGAREARGGLRVELLSVHGGLEEPAILTAYLYPEGRAVRVAWPGLAPGFYRWKELRYAPEA